MQKICLLKRVSFRALVLGAIVLPSTLSYGSSYYCGSYTFDGRKNDLMKLNESVGSNFRVRSFLEDSNCQNFLNGFATTSGGFYCGSTYDYSSKNELMKITQSGRLVSLMTFLEEANCKKFVNNLVTISDGYYCGSDGYSSDKKVLYKFRETSSRDQVIRRFLEERNCLDFVGNLF